MLVSRPRWFLVALASLSLAAPLAADPTSITDPLRLWVAEASAARLLQPDDLAFDLTLPGTAGAQAIAVDPAAQQVWIHSPAGLSLVDADGNSVQAWSTGSAPETSEPTHLAPVPIGTGAHRCPCPCFSRCSTAASTRGPRSEKIPP